MLFVIAALLLARGLSEFLPPVSFARAVPDGITQDFRVHTHELCLPWAHVPGKLSGFQWFPTVWSFPSLPDYLQALWLAHADQLLTTTLDW